MPAMTSMLCGCGLFFRIKQLSVTVEEQLNDGSPLKLWSADLFRCDGCGSEIISGFPWAKLAESYEPHYADIWRSSRPVYPGRRASSINS